MQHPPPSPGTTGLGNTKLLQLDGCTHPGYGGQGCRDASSCAGSQRAAWTQSLISHQRIHVGEQLGGIWVFCTVEVLSATEKE